MRYSCSSMRIEGPAQAELRMGFRVERCRLAMLGESMVVVGVVGGLCGGLGGLGWGRGYGGSRRRGMVVRDVGTLCFLMEWNERRWGGHGRCYLYTFLSSPSFAG